MFCFTVAVTVAGGIGAPVGVLADNSSFLLTTVAGCGYVLTVAETVAVFDEGEM